MKKAEIPEKRTAARKPLDQQELETRLACQALYDKNPYLLTKLSLPKWLVGTFILDTGKRYTFKGYEALYRLAEDAYPFKCSRKPSQCGLTTKAMGEMFYDACKGIITIYFLPNDINVGPHVKGRVFEILHRSKYLLDQVRSGKAGLSQELIVFTTGAKIYHRGIESKMGAYSIPADRIKIDEVDRISDMTDAAIAEERLGNRADVGIDYFCTPTIPGYGIDEIYLDQSDRRVWMVKCPHCGKWTELTWNGGVVEQVGERNWELRDKEWRDGIGRDINVYCQHCFRPVERFIGDYVPELENRKFHGYSLSRLFMTQHSVNSMWQKFSWAMKRPDRMQIFYNHWLGLPFIVSGAQLGLEDLQRNISNANFFNGSSRKDGTLNCVLGIDVNPSIGNHFVVIDISNKRVVEVGVKRWDELSELWSCYNICTTIIDRYPEVAKATELQKEHEGVYLAEYKDLGGLEYNIKQVVSCTDTGIDEIVNCVQIDRTVSLDGLFADIRSGDLRLPADLLELGGKVSGKGYCEYAAQFMSLIRSYKESGAGGEFVNGEVKVGEGLTRLVKAVYREIRGDHMAHAANYARQALGLIQNIPPIPRWRGVKEHHNESDVPDFLGEGW